MAMFGLSTTIRVSSHPFALAKTPDRVSNGDLVARFNQFERI